MIQLTLKETKKYVYFMCKDILVHKMHIVKNKFHNPIYDYENPYINDNGRICVIKCKGWNGHIYNSKRVVTYPINKNIKSRLTLKREIIFEKIKHK